MPYTVTEIAKLLGAEVAGDASLVLKGFAPQIAPSRATSLSPKTRTTLPGPTRAPPRPSSLTVRAPPPARPSFAFRMPASPSRRSSPCSSPSPSLPPADIPRRSYLTAPRWIPPPISGHIASWVRGCASGRARCCKVSTPSAPTACSGQTSTSSLTPRSTRAPRSAIAFASTPARSSGQTDSATCSITAAIARCPRSAM